MAEIKKISTELQLLDKFLDTSGDAGTSGQVLTSTGTGINWVSGGSLPGGPYLPLAGGTLTGDITLDDGSGASPSIYLKNGDDNFWRIFNGSNLDLTFRVGTVTKFSIDNSGNGTFAGNISFGDSHFIGDDADDNLLIQGSASENVIIRSEDGLYFRTGGDNTRLSINSSGNATFAGSVTLNGAAGHINLDSNNAAIFDNSNNNNAYYIRNGGTSSATLQIGTGSSPGSNIKLTLNGSGNVGIGTTSPDYKLEVQGVISSADAGLQKATFANVGNDLVLTANADATNATAKMLFNSSGSGGSAVSTKMIIDGSGNVGIGTTSPNQKLQVGGNLHVYDEEGDTDASIFVSTGTSNVTTVAIRSNGVSYLNGGNVGIGTTSPDVKLHIVGDGDRLEISSADYDLIKMGAYGDSGADLDNGFLNLSLNGSEKIRLLANGTSYFNGGNVGIGTTSPAVKLHIQGVANGTDGKLYITEDVSNGSFFKYDGATNRGSLGGLSTGGEGMVIDWSRTGSEIRLLTGNNERMRIDSDGNVGIGTTSPDSIVEILGNNPILTIRDSDTSTSTATSTIRFAESNANDSLGNYWDVGYSPVNLLNFDFNGSTKMTINSSGNVGIGTTSPSAKLDVTGSYGNIIKAVSGSQSITTSFVAPSTGSGLNNIISTAGEFNIGTSDAQPFSLATSSISRVSILSGGNVGIGTTSPGYKLEVVGNANITSTSGTTLKIEAKNPTAFNDPKIEFVTWNEASGSSSGKIQLTSGAFNNNDMAFFTETNNSVTEKMRIRSGGNVGIGITSPQAKLNVNGGIKIEGTSSLSFGGSSSIPAWAINSSGNDLIIDDQATTSGSVLFNNNEGVALPRLTTTQINAISSPTQGLMAYNTTLNTICFYNGSSWQKVSHASM